MSVDNQEITSVPSYDAGSSSGSIDDLIPEELRAAVEAEAPAAKEEDSSAGGESKKAVDPLEGNYDDPVELEEDEPILDDDDDSVENEDPEDEGKQVASEDDDELDLSDDSIDKLISGDLDAINKKKSAEDEEAPLWHSDKEYKKLVEQASYAGFDQAKIDKIIQTASDKKVIENGAYLQGLKKKNEELSNSQSLMKAEMERLQKIERAAHFDTSDEAKTNYGIPMAESVKKMRQILELEGADVPISDVLATKDRASLNHLFADYDLDDDNKTRLFNYWKEYRNLDTAYQSEKAQAQEDLSKHLATNIGENVAENVMRTNLIEFMNASDKYSYIKEAVDSGLDERPEVKALLGTGKANFYNMLKALGSPSDYVHNEKWLGGLSKFMLDAAHNKHISNKYYEREEQYKATQQKLVKIVKAYKELAGSAKGIRGKGKGVAYSRQESSRDSIEDNLAEFNDFLSGKLKIEDILP